MALGKQTKFVNTFQGLPGKSTTTVTRLGKMTLLLNYYYSDYYYKAVPQKTDDDKQMAIRILISSYHDSRVSRKKAKG